MALTNPSKLINLQELQYFEGKLALKYQGKTISISGITATTVEGALAELAGAIAGLPSAIVPKGTKAFAGLTPATDLAAGNVGYMWNISDAFTTTADFAEGAGHSIPAGANVYVANVGTAAEPSYKYDIFQGMYDLSGYALKSEMAINAVSGDATKKEIVLKTGLSQEVVVAHQDISGKADKDTDAVSGNFAIFDANGNPVDGDCKPEAFQPAGNYKTTQTAKTDPSAGSTPGVSFIASITQDANGEITATKENVQSASASQAGLMSAAHYSKLEAIAVAADSDIDEIFA